MTTKRVLFMFALFFQLLAVRELATSTEPWFIEPTPNRFDLDVQNLLETRRLDRSPAVETLVLFE